MFTRNLLRALPRCLLAAALAAGVTTTAIYAVDGDPPGLFELDGNTVDSGAAGDDWDLLFPDNPKGTSVASTGILPDPARLSIFTGGDSKDIDDVTEWRHTNGNVPPKDNITNAYARAYTVPVGKGTGVHDEGDLIIYFGLDRFANNGDAFAGFWFFQDEVSPNPDGTFEGQHEPGDLLILVEYPQGANEEPEIKIYKWVASGGDVAENLLQIQFSGSDEALCDSTVDDQLACAITNIGALDGAPAWPYVNSKGFDGIPLESFYEGGINVSKLLGGDAPCFSSFLAETRASRSEDAVLKDFVLGNFDLCAIEVTKACTAAVSDQDGGNSVLVDFDGVVTNSGGLALNNVTVTDDNGTPGNTGDDIVVFGPATLQPGESQPYSGSYSTLDNTPTDTVTAVGQRNGTTVDDTAVAECEAPINPAIAVDKICVADVNGDGTGIDVLFNGTVTNIGNVALKDITVVDDNGTPDNLGDDVTVALPDLNVGESAPYSGGFGVLGANESIDNVIARGVDVLTEKEVSATADARCNVTPITKILVTKICTATINSSGTGIDVLFSGLVTNDGNEILEGVTVVDDNGTPGVPGDDVTVVDPINLAPGASVPFSGSFGAKGPSSTDVVTATGTGLLSRLPVLETATASCDTPVIPAIDVTKQCTDAPAFGQAILFDGTVTNNGNVALLDVIVVDDNGTPGVPGDDVTFNLGNLAPNGGSANYNGSYTPALAGPSTNTVVASGSDAILSQSVSSTPASATCEVPPPPGEEGCTPGFWKNSPGSWPPTGYSPDQLLTSVFSLPNGQINNQLGGDSLMDALNYEGGETVVGAAQILLRAAVASLLNSAHPDVDFPRSTAAVIAAVNAALATKDRGEILKLALALDADNNLGCDLPNDDSF